MSGKYNQNQLQIQRFPSMIQDGGGVKIASAAELQQFVKARFVGEGKIAAWLDYAICFGFWRNGNWTLAEEIAIKPVFLERLRVFNDKEELHVWRESEGIFAWRLRQDEGTGAEVGCVEARTLLWGQVAAANGEFSLLRDAGRNLQLKVPQLASEGKQLYLKTRNYIGYNDKTGQAGYVDSRFVDIVEGR